MILARHIEQLSPEEARLLLATLRRGRQAGGDVVHYWLREEEALCFTDSHLDLYILRGGQECIYCKAARHRLRLRAKGVMRSDEVVAFIGVNPTTLRHLANAGLMPMFKGALPALKNGHREQFIWMAFEGRLVDDWPRLKWVLHARANMIPPTHCFRCSLKLDIDDTPIQLDSWGLCRYCRLELKGETTYYWSKDRSLVQSPPVGRPVFHSVRPTLYWD